MFCSSLFRVDLKRKLDGLSSLPLLVSSNDPIFSLLAFRTDRLGGVLKNLLLDFASTGEGGASISNISPASSISLLTSRMIEENADMLCFDSDDDEPIMLLFFGAS
jgi:hypothetical protein